MNFNENHISGLNDDCHATTVKSTTTVADLNNMFLSYGWVCPKCGRVYSPSTSMCLWCVDYSNEIKDYKPTWKWKDYITCNGTAPEAHYDNIIKG